MKWLLTLSVLSAAALVVTTLHRRYQVQQLPTAEHKARWEHETRWSGTRWERVS